MRDGPIFCTKIGAVTEKLNPFMHNVVKWPNIILKSCGVNTARFLKYVWPFYNIMHERVKKYKGNTTKEKKQPFLLLIHFEK